MMGSSDISQVESGVIPRAIHFIFDKIVAVKEAKKTDFVLSVSYMEIYNESLRDLLHPSISSKAITIREDQEGGIIVCGAKEERATTLAEVMALLQLGAVARTTASTLMNDASSRSHSIFTIYLQQTQHVDGALDCRLAKFHLVDLAGSERNKRTGNVGIRFKESIGINSGLLALGNVISVLGDEKRRQSAVHIPYRDSKLTRVLQDSLGGNSKTVMIACVSPADSNFEETLNTLKYASRAKLIQNKPVINRSSLEKWHLADAFYNRPEEQTEQLQQAEQELTVLKATLLATQQQLQEAQQDLQRDEEIFREKIAEIKLLKREKKELQRENTLLREGLATGGQHDSSVLGTSVLSAASGTADQEVQASLREEHTHMMQTAAVEMERQFEAVKANLLKGMKELAISNKLKEQLITELVKGEHDSQHHQQMSAEKIQRLEERVRALQEKLRATEREVAGGHHSTESAAKAQEATAKLRQTERELEALRKGYETDKVKLQRRVAELEKLAKQQRDEKRQQRLRKEWLDSQIEDHLQERERLEKLERELRRKASLLKERELVSQRRKDLESKKSRSATPNPNASVCSSAAPPSSRGSSRSSQALQPVSPLAPPPPAQLQGVHPESVFSEEEEETLRELQDRSEAIQTVLSYVDSVIDEAKRDLLLETGITDPRQSVHLQPGDIKQLAVNKLNEKFTQFVGTLKATEAKEMVSEYLYRIVDFKEKERRQSREVMRLEQSLQDQRAELEMVLGQLNFLTEEHDRVKRDLTETSRGNKRVVDDQLHEASPQKPQQERGPAAMQCMGTQTMAPQPEPDEATTQRLEQLDKDNLYYVTTNKQLRHKLRDVIAERRAPGICLLGGGRGNSARAPR
eukprot:TRINITY_DN9697_c0_g1_i4.p1 TRINITY_DN9697_c0_g1~~TRINITY_DN9697_c0_g1_i4.p1  ORF type:complete len:865 (+),score=189.93 TRINITY_DN9697_c0_g1_i4:336-2930(+)